MGDGIDDENIQGFEFEVYLKCFEDELFCQRWLPKVYIAKNAVEMETHWWDMFLDFLVSMRVLRDALRHLGC